MKLSNISPRVSQILQILLEQNAPISVKALAEQMNLEQAHDPERDGFYQHDPQRI